MTTELTTRESLVIRGDSVSNFKLLQSIKDQTLPTVDISQHSVVHALSKAVFERGRPKRHERLSDLFTVADRKTMKVKFLTMERIMGDDERADVKGIVNDVIDSGTFTSGQYVDMFEEQVASFLGRKHVIACGSGTDSLSIALRAAGVEPGDEVIMPSNSFAATENAVLAIGAIPVLVDTERHTWNLNPGLIEAKITPKTKAVTPVHLYGKRVNVAAIRDICDKHGLMLVDDCAQCIGLTGLGEYSDLSVLSFNPVKNFGVCGKAGAVLTDSHALAVKCRNLNYHGFAVGVKNVKDYDFGFNARMDNLQCAIGLARLRYLGLNNFKRLYLADRYISALRKLETAGTIELPNFADDHVWHLFAVRLADEIDRDRLISEMQLQGVGAEVCYPILTHKHATSNREKLFKDTSCPVTEANVAQLINLPLYGNFSLHEQDRVIEQFIRCLSRML